MVALSSSIHCIVEMYSAYWSINNSSSRVNTSFGIKTSSHCSIISRLYILVHINPICSPPANFNIPVFGIVTKNLCRFGSASQIPMRNKIPQPINPVPFNLISNKFQPVAINPTGITKTTHSPFVYSNPNVLQNSAPRSLDEIHVSESCIAYFLHRTILSRVILATIVNQQQLPIDNCFSAWMERTHIFHALPAL